MVSPVVLAWVAPALAGTLSGRVLEKGTAAPIGDAEIQLDDAVLPVGADGRFSVTLPDGDREVVFVGPNHLPQTVQITLPSDEPLRVFLQRAPTPAEIVVESFRPTSDMTRHRVDAETAADTPGTYDDAVRLVQALPGVAVQREFSPTSGDLAVRGSRPGDNRFLLDGIDIPYLYHFNQYASVFPASWLDTLDLYSSGYGARFGDASGAVLDARTDPRRPRDVTGSVSFNLVTIGADVKVPVDDKTWVGVSGRRSFHDVAGGSDQYPLWPRFYDAALRVEHGDATSGHGMYAVAAGDRYDRAVGELDGATPLEIEATPTLRYGRDWQLVGYRYRWRHGRAVAGVLHDHDRGTVDGGRGEHDVRTLSFPVRVDAHRQVSPVFGVSAGGSLRAEVAWFRLQGDPANGALVAQEAPGVAYGTDLEETRLRTRAGAYTELSFQGGPLRVMPGVRVGLDSVGVTPTVEPRLAARIRVAEQTELRFGGGRYQQRPSSLRAAVDPDLPTTDGWSLVAGLDQTVANRLEFVLDGFLHTQRHPITDPTEGLPTVWDRGLSVGGELTVRYRIREVFFAWAYVTVGRAWLWDEVGRVPSPSDQPASGGLVVSWNVLPPLQLALRYRAASGLPYTPLSGSVYDAGGDAWLPQAGRPFSARLPFYQKIDLRIAYTATFRRWTLQAALDVWIVPGRARTLYPTWRYDFGEEGLVLGPTVLPLIGLRAGF